MSAPVAVALEVGYACGPVAVACGVVVGTAVVMSRFYRLGRKNVIKVFAAVVVRPVLDYLKHVVVDFAVRVAESRVVEDADDVAEDLVDGDVGMVPGVDDAGRDVLQDRHGDLASRCVENV